MQKRVEKESPCQGFLQRSYEQKKSSKFEGTENVKQETDGLSTMFNFANDLTGRKQEGKSLDGNVSSVYLEKFSFKEMNKFA